MGGYLQDQCSLQGTLCQVPWQHGREGKLCLEGSSLSFRTLSHRISRISATWSLRSLFQMGGLSWSFFPGLRKATRNATSLEGNNLKKTRVPYGKHMSEFCRFALSHSPRVFSMPAESTVEIPIEVLESANMSRCCHTSWKQ